MSQVIKMGSWKGKRLSGKGAYIEALSTPSLLRVDEIARVQQILTAESGLSSDDW